MHIHNAGCNWVSQMKMKFLSDQNYLGVNRVFLWLLNSLLKVAETRGIYKIISLPKNSYLDWMFRQDDSRVSVGEVLWPN